MAPLTALEQQEQADAMCVRCGIARPRVAWRTRRKSTSRD
jgi:hypothetical protein